MNLSNLTDGLGNIKDELTGEFKNLGEEVIEGKLTPTDALHQGEEKAMDSFKGMFGSDENKAETTEQPEDNSADEPAEEETTSTDETEDADSDEEK